MSNATIKQERTAAKKFVLDLVKYSKGGSICGNCKHFETPCYGFMGLCHKVVLPKSAKNKQHTCIYVHFNGVCFGWKNSFAGNPLDEVVNKTGSDNMRFTGAKEEQQHMVQTLFSKHFDPVEIVKLRKLQGATEEEITHLQETFVDSFTVMMNARLQELDELNKSLTSIKEKISSLKNELNIGEIIKSFVDNG